jgi:hypothetical protein
MPNNNNANKKVVFLPTSNRRNRSNSRTRSKSRPRSLPRNQKPQNYRRSGRNNVSRKPIQQVVVQRSPSSTSSLNQMMSTMSMRSSRARSAPSFSNNPFYRCKSDPRCMIACSIPDGASGTHIPVTLYGVNQISTTGTGFAIQCLAWFPTPAMLAAYGSASMTIDGATTPSGGIDPPGIGFSYFPLGSASNFFGPGQRPGANADIYNAASMRFVNVKFVITNTTAPMFRSGSFQVFTNNITLNDINSITTVATTTTTTTPAVAARTFDSITGTGYTATTGVPILLAGGNINSGVSQNNVQQFSMDKPVAVMLHHCTNSYEQQPVPNFSSLPTITPPSAAGTLPSVFPNMFKTAGTYGCSPTYVQAYDNDYTGVQINVNGLNSGGSTNLNSFVFETFLQLEVKPSSISQFNSFTRSGPPMNDGVMKAVSARTNMPPSMQIGDPK